MSRLFTTGMEIVGSAVIIIPVLMVYNKIQIHNIRKTILYGIFMFYLVAVCSLVGLPSVMDFHVDFYGNFIPFMDMVSDFKNSVLNVLLFVPLGIGIPCLWKDYRTLKRTTFVGFTVSMIIEILQIFTFRTSDVNDLITNVIGTMIGYGIANMLIRKVQWIQDIKNKKMELYIICGITVVIMVFIQPFLSSAMWEIVLKSY